MRSSESVERVDVLVVGAGISGLTFAYECAKHADVLVLEASERAGGWIETRRSDADCAAAFELGPEALTLSPGDDMAQWLEELALDLAQPDERVRRRYIAKSGRLVAAPLTPPALLSTSLLPIAAKARLALEPWRARDLALGGSIAGFARHRLGAGALQWLVDPMVAGIHGGDPEQLSVEACFPRLVQGVRSEGSVFAYLRARARAGRVAPIVAKPRDGMQALPRALAARLGRRLRTSTPVRAIERQGEFWIVQAGARRVRSRRLVLALPVGAAARLVAGVLPALAQELRSMRSESLVSLVHAYPRDAVRHPLDGFGYLVPSAEGLIHLGTLFSSTIQPTSIASGHVLLRTLLGGARTPDATEWTDAELYESVRREVNPLLRIRSAPSFTSIERCRHAIPRLDLEHPARRRRISASTPASMTLLGNYLDGIGLTTLVREAAAAGRRHAAAPSRSTA